MAKLTQILSGVLLCAPAFLAGCAGDRAVRQASDAFERARQVGAETKAPYEYYAAQEYLKLAEHEQAEMDTVQAEVFAEQSQQKSTRAIEKVGGGAR